MTDTPNWRDPDLTSEERAKLLDEWIADCCDDAVDNYVEIYKKFGELCSAKAQAHANALTASLEAATEIIHAEREKLKQANALDALLAEAVETMKLYLSNYPQDRDGMDGSGPLPVGVKRARAFLAKVEAAK